MRSYTTAELFTLMKVRAKGYDNFLDDQYTSDRAEHTLRITNFLIWIDKMEKEEKIDYLLKTGGENGF